MRHFTKEEKAFLTEIIPGRCDPLVRDMFFEKFGREIGKITLSNFKRIRGIKSGVRSAKGYRSSKLWTREVKEWIFKNHYGKKVAELRDSVNEKFGTNYTWEQVRNFKRQHELNSGPILRRYYKPNNCLPVGSERLVKPGLWKIKMFEPSTWEMAHELVWTFAYGPHPKGAIIAFVDGDSSNYALENLMLITRGESAIMNRTGTRRDGGLKNALTYAHLRQKVFKLKKRLPKKTPRAAERMEEEEK